MTGANTNIRTLRALPGGFDLQAHFDRCLAWNDAVQWDALAMLYYQRGYLLNALHCFERADACRARVPVAVETEVPA